MENDGFYMNLLTSDKLRVLGSDLLCFTDDLYSAYRVYFTVIPEKCCAYYKSDIYYW
jgi:hypothetical protein